LDVNKLRDIGVASNTASVTAREAAGSWGRAASPHYTETSEELKIEFF
jgi:hypothetical protein